MFRFWKMYGEKLAFFIREWLSPKGFISKFPISWLLSPNKSEINPAVKDRAIG